ncbi:MAG: hypothetical protein ACI906_001533 [Candidatus Latescibacterota bacterium]|jgi:hypothetical protein
MHCLRDIDWRQPAHLASLLLAALLLGLFLGLPLGHQLFHDGLVESESCPVHMLESSLVLLFGTLLTLVFLQALSEGAVAFAWSVPLPYFFFSFSRSNRGPPRF